MKIEQLERLMLGQERRKPMFHKDYYLRKLMKILVFIIVIFFMSCEKDNLEDRSPKIIWRKQLGPKLYEQLSYDPILYKNDIIFGYQTEFTAGYDRFNANSGKLVKRYDDINSNWFNSFLIENVYFSSCGRKGATLDLETNKIENFRINIETDLNGVSINPYNRDFYSGFTSTIFIPSGFPINEYKIRRSSDFKSWYTVWENKFEKEEDMFGVGLGSLVYELNEKGEEIVYIPSILSFKQAARKAKYKVEAVNLTQNKLVWQTNTFEVDSTDLGNLSSFAPQIFENLIICGISGSHLMAFDKNTGEKIWSNYFENQLCDTKLIIYNGKITVICNTSDLVLIDAKTGKILRKQVFIGGAGSNWSINNGLIYLTNALGRLYCINADTHEIKWDLKSPNKANCNFCNFFLASPVVDPVTNRLYISDRKEVICYQLP